MSHGRGLVRFMRPPGCLLAHVASVQFIQMLLPWLRVFSRRIRPRCKSRLITWFRVLIGCMAALRPWECFPEAFVASPAPKAQREAHPPFVAVAMFHRAPSEIGSSAVRSMSARCPLLATPSYSDRVSPASNTAFLIPFHQEVLADGDGRDGRLGIWVGQNFCQSKYPVSGRRRIMVVGILLCSKGAGCPIIVGLM